MVREDGAPLHPAARVTALMSNHAAPESIAGMLAMLRQAVVFPYESIDQVVHEHGSTDLGDPATPGTAAWHMCHIVEIFRQHARVAMVGLSEHPARVDGVIAAPDGFAWTNAAAARDALLRDIDAFIVWTTSLPPASLSRPLVYGNETNLPRMIACMSVHITWHAAAVHYWCKWKRPAATAPS